MSMENVLDEVESLFKKISSLPENVRQAAINKIHERLAPNSCFNAGIASSAFPQASLEVTLAGNASTNEFLNPTSTSIALDTSFTDSKFVVDSTKVGKEQEQGSNLQCLKPKKQPPRSKNKVPKKTRNKNIKEMPPNVMHVDLHPSVQHPFISSEQFTSNVDGTAFQINMFEQVPPRSVTQLPPMTFMCAICDAQIEGKKNLKLHLKTHKPKRPYACPKCEKTFKQSSNLNVHLKRHNGQRDFPCNLCDYKSVTKLDLERHLCKHSQKRDLICEFCAKAFSVKRSLFLHIRTVHKKEEFEYNCAECPFMTRQKHNLKVHVRLRHLNDYYTHVCPVCGARVKLKSAFLEHLRAHTGDRPFSCELCPATFACVGRLNTHRRTLHAPRQFSCVLCNKKFPTKYSLQRHVTTHTNDKPHSCPFCNFACNMQGNLTKHIRNMHQQPEFSLREYKRQQQNNTVKRKKDKKRWTEKGQEAFDQYLNTLSEKLGRQVTVNELKAQEEDRRKQQVAAKEKAKIERITRITNKEHSYFLKPESPPPSSPDILPLPTNIYLEAIAAANLDFTSANIVESLPLPDLGDSVARSYSLQPGVRFVPPMSSLEFADFSSSSPAFLLADHGEDKMSMDPMLSTYSEVLQVPPLGLDSLNSSLIDMPNVYLQLPNGDKVQWNLRDSQFIDSGVSDQMQAPLAQVEGLRDFLPSVMIVVGESMDQEPEPPS